MDGTYFGGYSAHRRGMKSMTVPGGTEADAMRLRAEAHGELLLPGIPNDITLDQIIPKLPWRTFYVLSVVSHAWLHAIRSRQVYDARVRSNSTETLVLLKYTPSKRKFAIALYFHRDNLYRELPPIPGLDRGIPEDCRYVSLDGKLYVLGGYSGGCCSVYVLDLAGQKWQWKQCSSMQNREDFGCGAINGKIYVFGGTLCFKPICGSEEYDPEKDTWSPIKSMPSLRCNHSVLTIGEELVVHHGKVFDPKYWEVDARTFGYDYDHYTKNACTLEAYHPTKEEWRVIDQFPRFDKNLFMFQGKLHGLLVHDVYHIETKSWTYLQSAECCKIGTFCDWPSGCDLQAVLALNDELLAVVFWSELNNFRINWAKCLIRGEGIGSENETIMWHKVENAPPFKDWPVEWTAGQRNLSNQPTFGIHPIQL